MAISKRISGGIRYIMPEGELKGEPLYAKKEEMGGVGFVVTLWEFTPEEVERIEKGGVLELWISGDRMPIVSLNVRDE